MALENLVGADKFLNALVPTNPTGGDDKREGDDHIRGVKNTLKNTFPNITGAVTLNQTELNALPGAMDGKVDVAGDTMTGPLTVNGALKAKTHLTLESSGAITIPQVEWRASDTSLRAYISMATQTAGASTDEFRHFQQYGFQTFYTHGAESLRIDAAGSVGIGTTTPNKFTIGRALTVNAPNVGNYAGYEISVQDALVASFVASAAETRLTANNPSILATYTGNAERMRIDAAGNVGINKNNPTAKLHVNAAANTNDGIRWTDSATNTGFLTTRNIAGAGHAGIGADGGILFSTGQGGIADAFNERMRIVPAGNVAIGNTNPQKLVDVLQNQGGLRLSHGGALTDFSELSFSLSGLAGNAAAIRSYRASGTYVGNEGDLRFYTFNGSANPADNALERMRITDFGVIQDGAGLELGYKDVPRVAGGLERGKCWATAAGFTVNAGVAGQYFRIYNDSNVSITVTQGVGVTLRLGGSNTTGNRGLNPHTFAELWYNAAGDAILNGPGVT
ncbi:MAG TPA: hypothetical protein VLC08_06180 [Chitinolyticbacter sp.]|nr:hypothetical protein [Chitinolyticbacter sp.]